MIDGAGLRGELRKNESLSGHTSSHVDGAAWYVRPADLAELAERLDADMPVTVSPIRPKCISSGKRHE